MTSNCKKPGVAFWATVVAGAVLVAYPLSFGPACWITSRLDRGAGLGRLSPDWVGDVGGERHSD